MTMEHAHTTETPPEMSDRWAAVEMKNGEVIVYDKGDPTAWVSSDAAVDARAHN